MRNAEQIEQAQAAWYCVRTKAHKERSVESILRSRLSLETYYPKWRCRRPVAGSMRMVLSPLFPGYLFAKFDLGKDRRNITYAREVLQIVAFAGEPVVVDPRIIAEMKQFAAEKNRDDIFETRQQYRPGDEVIVEAGPFKRFRGIFERELPPDGERVAILLELLQQQSRVTLPRDYIRPANVEHPLSATQ